MALFVTTCPKFLGLLRQFYDRLPEQPPTDAELIEPEEVPQPHRSLLVHCNDMTPTLEGYHGEKIVLRVLQRSVTEESLSRHIVLEGLRTGKPVEYGAIRIDLGPLDEDSRRQVLECRVPLGSILNSHGVAHASCPGGFFRVRPNALIRRVLSLNGTPWLYGRCNCLSDSQGRMIAEVVEILPCTSGFPA